MITDRCFFSVLKTGVLLVFHFYNSFSNLIKGYLNFTFSLSANKMNPK